MSNEITTRPDWDEYFMGIAFAVARRGSCRRKQVGAVIVAPDRCIISGGYNGAPRGEPDCLENGCDVRVIDGRESCVRTLHAESNAIDFARRPLGDAWLYCTVIPCRPCALRIVQSGISRVFYAEYYESQGTRETLKTLDGANVDCVQLAVRPLS